MARAVVRAVEVTVVVAMVAVATVEEVRAGEVARAGTEVVGPKVGRARGWLGAGVEHRGSEGLERAAEEQKVGWAVGRAARAGVKAAEAVEEQRVVQNTVGEDQRGRSRRR